MKRLSLILCLITASFGLSAQASEYGCKVLLCLSNPKDNGGPLGVAECVDPVRQLYKDLSKGKPFPTCTLADGNDGSSYARQGYDPYDLCPAGTSGAKRGERVIQGDSINNRMNYRNSYRVSESPMKACVANYVGTVGWRECRDCGTVSGNVYKTVIWLKPQNPRVIDVYVDGQFSQRVRW